MFKNNHSGLGLIGVLLIIGALVVTTGGVLVWQKKTNPTPSPIPTPTPLISLTPINEPSSTPLTIGSEEYCHQFRHDNCPKECQVGPSCPICQDVGCHAKGAHQIRVTPIFCQTVADCPPGIGVCVPGKCPSWRCVGGRCVYFEDVSDEVYEP